MHTLRSDQFPLLLMDAIIEENPLKSGFLQMGLVRMVDPLGIYPGIISMLAMGSFPVKP